MKPVTETLLSLLLMRFNLIKSQSIPLVEDWLERHPGNSWTTVEKSLKSGKLIFKDGSLHDIQQPSSQPTEFNDNACFRSDQEIIDLAKFAALNSTFQALSDPLRIQVVELLRSQELCVGQLRSQLEVSPSKLSFHLKQLKEANLILSRHEGRWIYYRLNLAQFVVLEQYLAVYRRFSSIMPAAPRAGNLCPLGSSPENPTRASPGATEPV